MVTDLGLPGSSMRINLRQEIAMWVLGMIWTVLGFASLLGSNEWGLVQSFMMQIVLLVPMFLIVFSLRDRKKAN
jgi:hypothetical protein